MVLKANAVIFLPFDKFGETLLFSEQEAVLVQSRHRELMSLLEGSSSYRQGTDCPRNTSQWRRSIPRLFWLIVVSERRRNWSHTEVCEGAISVLMRIEHPNEVVFPRNPGFCSIQTSQWKQKTLERCFLQEGYENILHIYLWIMVTRDWDTMRWLWIEIAILHWGMYSFSLVRRDIVDSSRWTKNKTRFVLSTPPGWRPSLRWSLYPDWWLSRVTNG